MLPSKFDTPPDFDALVAGLDKPRGNRAFALESNLVKFHKTARKDYAKRRGLKKLIKPENAVALVDALPVEPDDRTHCVLRGDFVLCDLIPAIIARHGRCPALHIATLGLSVANASQLADLRTTDKVGALTVICSHYFAGVDRTTTFRQVAAKLEPVARLVVSRNHCKVICLPTESGQTYVIEGSANLRSSDNIEQLVITNDPETLAFHVGWMDNLSPADA